MRRQRHRSAIVQLISTFVFSLHRLYNSSPSFFINRNLKPLAILCGCTAWFFVSDMFANPEERFFFAMTLIIRLTFENIKWSSIWSNHLFMINQLAKKNTFIFINYDQSIREKIQTSLYDQSIRFWFGLGWGFTSQSTIFQSGRSHCFLGITSTFCKVNVSCSRIQHSDPSEDRTPDLSLRSPTLYH